MGRMALNTARLVPVGSSKSQISLLHGKNGESTRFGGSRGKSAGFDRELVSSVAMFGGTLIQLTCLCRDRGKDCGWSPSW